MFVHPMRPLLLFALPVLLATSGCPQYRAAPAPPTQPDSEDHQTSSRRPQSIEDFMTPGQGVRVIAHRGFSGRAPENTLVALEMAMDIKADMAEIDVGLTRDGHVVVLHDDTLDRTTDGKGLLSAATLEEVRQLDAGSWFAPEFAGEPVPTLGEVLDLVRGKMLLNIEVKTEAVTDTAAGGIVDKVLELVHDRDMLGQIVISSFDPRALAHARQLEPRVKTASLYNHDLHKGQSPLEVMAAVGSNGFNTRQKRITQQIVTACHRHRRPVAVYTVNTEKTMERLIALGVDALFTDYPDRLHKVLRQQADAPRAAGR